MSKTTEPDYKKLLTKFRMDLDARYDGETGFIYFDGGRAFFKLDEKGELDVRESWGEPTQTQAQRIYMVLNAWILHLKSTKGN